VGKVFNLMDVVPSASRRRQTTLKRITREEEKQKHSADRSCEASQTKSPGKALCVNKMLSLR
jgi:hypothetical protein